MYEHPVPSSASETAMCFMLRTLAERGLHTVLLHAMFTGCGTSPGIPRPRARSASQRAVIPQHT
jgi:hypothetical protein